MVVSPERFGPYLVYEQLGSGGMASVHRAEVAGIEGFSRSIALKRMLPAIANKPELVQSFVREARIASYLRHANVPQTYELGKVGDIYFIAMELVTGRTLRDILRHCAQTTGPMPVTIAMNILNQICDALDYAHNLCDESGRHLGIIHRDVSPSNVIVGETGNVKLIDWGIAKSSTVGLQTMSGTLKGKYGYMAPEYIEGTLDARADLFAVGVMAHELLTNRPLFTVADDHETLTRVRTMEILPPSRKNPQVPLEIDDIVMTALARDPTRRWQHATALRNALTTVTKRLGLVVQDAYVVEWIEWAFGQRVAVIGADATAPLPQAAGASATDIEAARDSIDGAHGADGANDDELRAPAGSMSTTLGSAAATAPLPKSPSASMGMPVVETPMASPPPVKLPPKSTVMGTGAHASVASSVGAEPKLGPKSTIMGIGGADAVAELAGVSRGKPSGEPPNPGALAPPKDVFITRPTPTSMAAFAIHPSTPDPTEAPPLPAGTPSGFTAQRSIPPEPSRAVGNASGDVPSLQSSQSRMLSGEPADRELPSATPIPHRPTPPNRQSPVALAPPIRSSGRLDERAAMMRPPELAAARSPSSPRVGSGTTANKRSDERASAVSASASASSSRHANRASVLLTVLMVLVTAAIVAAAVYFVLPRVL